MKLRTAISAGMLGTTLLIAPATGHAQAPTTARVATDVDAALLDPRIMRDTTAYRTDDLLFDGLVELDPTGTPKPGLAQSWDHPDPLTWMFHLRPGVTFQDGSPLTAADVVYTVQTTLEPARASRFRGLLTPIKTITAVDDHTVRIDLSQPYAPLLNYLELGIVPRSVASAPNADLSSHPIGSGPMKLVDWKRGNSITLEANPNYWGGAPKLKRMTLVIVGDNTARAQALEAGDVDLIQSPLSPQDVQRLLGESKFKHATMGSPAITFFVFNTTDPIVGNPAMRHALAHLIDQKTIITQIYGGIDQAANSILLPGSLAYTDTLRQPDFDVAQAGKELAALGWVRGAGGKLMKDGKPLTITISTHSEDPNRVQTVEFLQATFNDAGIDTKVTLSDFPSFFANVTGGRTQMAMLGLALGITDPDRGLYDELHTGGGANWSKYSNPQFDQLVEQGRRGEDRAAAYQKAAGILTQELPMYLLSYQGYQAFYRPEFSNFVPNGRGYLRSLLQ